MEAHLLRSFILPLVLPTELPVEMDPQEATSSVFYPLTFHSLLSPQLNIRHPVQPFGP